MEKLSRSRAIETGSYLYFTGEPCKHGHVAQRYTRTCVCTECHKQNNARQTRRLNESLQGVRTITLRAHPDDVVSLQQYVDLLCAQRGLRIAQSWSPTAAQQLPAPTVALSTDEDRLAHWTRLHGPTIARQMLNQSKRQAQ